MDPDEALRLLRGKMELIETLHDKIEAEQEKKDRDVTQLEEWSSDLSTASSEAVDLFRGLDGWMSRGGFPPKAWKK